MNKKAIAGILARLDDPEMIEQVLDLITNKADATPAESEPAGQLVLMSEATPQRRAVVAPMARHAWPDEHTQIMLQMKADGYTTKAIAYRLGRSPKAVSDRLYRIRTGQIA